MSQHLPRRDFLVHSGLAAGALATLGLAACREAADSAADAIRDGAAPVALTPDEVRTLGALSDRILPPEGSFPGAEALGTAVFMDRYLARNEGMLGDTRFALGILEEVAPGFADLSTDAQDAGVAAFADHPSGIFGLVRFLTILGAFAAPAHGGNRDEAGWALLGFDNRHAWQPPFGTYDAAAQGGDA